MTKYKIQVDKTKEQIDYTGAIEAVDQVMTAISCQNKSDVTLFASWPVSDGYDCIDYEVEVVKNLKY